MLLYELILRNTSTHVYTLYYRTKLQKKFLCEFLSSNLTLLHAGRNEFDSMKLTFHFDILEVTEVDDVGQSLSMTMYLSVSWPERRLWINSSDEAWRQNITGPENVRVN